MRDLFGIDTVYLSTGGLLISAAVYAWTIHTTLKGDRAQNNNDEEERRKRIFPILVQALIAGGIGFALTLPGALEAPVNIWLSGFMFVGWIITTWWNRPGQKRPEQGPQEDEDEEQP